MTTNASKSPDALRIDIEAASVSYPLDEGGRRTILDDIHLRVCEGEFTTVVGPSGCGKSTLLRLILGSQFPDAGGVVLVDGQSVQRVTRDCGIVYQGYSLFPHLTVLDNIAFGLVLEHTNILQRVACFPLNVIDKVLTLIAHGLTVRAGANLSKPLPAVSQEPVWTKLINKIGFFKTIKESRAQARELLSVIGLDTRDGDKYPYELSGGMRQRVAIAQSIVMRPKILLLDEPFGALDAKTREGMQDFIHDSWAKFNLTVFFVTHDLDEAARLGTRLICLSQHWTQADGNKGQGSRIVFDRKIEGGHTTPSEFKATPEFQELIARVGSAGLRASQPVAEGNFELSHPDAFHYDEEKAVAPAP